MKKPHFTKKYVRYRVRNPKSFRKDSFRTLDVGRKGHSKVIIGKTKSGKVKTQSILLSRKDYDNGQRVDMSDNTPKIYHLKSGKNIKI